MGSVLVLFAVTAVLVLLLGALAVFAVWWALFGDRARHRRCPRCWHDLTGTQGLRCGECGHEARHERELHRTRRRWGAAAAALAAILGVTAWVRLEALGSSWTSHVPDWVLVRMPGALPDGAMPAWAWQELGDRIGADALAAPDVLALVGTFAGGTPVGDPDDPAVRALAYASRTEPPELRRDGRDRGPDRDAAGLEAARAAFERDREAALARIAPWIELEAPSQWTPGERPMARVRGTVWGRDTEWRIRATEGGDPWLVGDGMSALRMQPAFGALPLPMPSGDGRVRARLTVQTRRRGDDGTWGGWSPAAPIAVDAEVRPLADAALAADDSAATREAVLGAFGFPVTLWSDEDRPAGIRFNPRAFSGGGFGDLLVGVTVELLEGEAVRRRSRLWWPGSGIERTGWEVEREDLDALRRLRRFAEDAARLEEHPDGGRIVPGWSLRVRGERLAALRAARAGRLEAGPLRWWSGEVTLPLRIGERPSPAPRRSFRTEPWAGPDP